MGYTEPTTASRKPSLMDGSPDLFSVPVTPYKDQAIPTMGHSGTKTSHERAIQEVVTGEATERQLLALAVLDKAGANGLNWKEFDVASGINHHGRTSSVLTSLHQAGRIVRLDEIRNRCLVYVLPQYVNGRLISPIISIECACGKSLKPAYNYCPYCGAQKSV